MPRKRAIRDMDGTLSPDRRQADGSVPDLASDLPDSNEGGGSQHDQQQSQDHAVEDLGDNPAVFNGIIINDDGLPHGQAQSIHIRQMQDAASSQLQLEAAGSRPSNVNSHKISNLIMPTAFQKPRPVATQLSQRRLRGPTQVARPDAYDIEEPPWSRMLVPRISVRQQQHLSPLRRERKMNEAPTNKVSNIVRTQVRRNQELSTAGAPDRSKRRKAGAPAVFLQTRLQNSEELHKLKPRKHSDEVPSRESGLSQASLSAPNPSRSGMTRHSTADDNSDVREKEHTDEADTSRRAHHNVSTKVIPGIQKIRHSELYPHDEESEEGLEDSQSDHTAMSASVETPKKSGSPRKPPDGQRERSSKTQADKPGLEAEEVDVGDSLLGQWRIIHRALSAARGVHAKIVDDIDLDDIDILSTIACIEVARNELEGVLHQSKNAGEIHDLPQTLKHLTSKIQGLCGQDKDLLIDFQDQNKSGNIYGHLMPQMVEFLAHAATCFMAEDQVGDHSDGSVSIEHFRFLADVVDLVVKLGLAAKHQYERPRSVLAIIRITHDKLVVPLRSVSQTFRRHIERLEQSRSLAAAATRGQAEEMHRQREEEERAVQVEKIRRLRWEWFRLHEERRGVELHFLPREKVRHLFMVEHAPEYDYNGLPLERLQVLRPRIGPPPALVDKARQRQWEEDEIMALCEGLQRFAGRRVFQDIFREYCVRGGPLNKYNVTEIVTMAADAKEFYEQQQAAQVGEVEDWVKSIPEWTKPHNLQGKENDGEDEQL